ncbi:hypothetical protein SLEP1_g20030 [Rubroshorea leprosula]|uniref:CCHC-type domain-containing protein n=1 Tax=Rubroshorea leprosula TaxID=152421 RepID=A0AAV5J785_9ROSI|nr:hypothetical protein SLEP1_g20030 [Rubroshorea leprosula]
MDDFYVSQVAYQHLKTTYRLNYGDNFAFWKVKVKMVLTDNCVQYVLTTPKPSKEDDAARHDKWVADDFTARHIILGSIHDDLFMSYSEHETTKSMMDALSAFFTKPSLGKRMALLQRYMSHQMKGGTSINQHVLEMDNMAMELEREGMKVPEEMQSAALMNSLPSSWEDVIVNITTVFDFDRNGESTGLKNVKDRLKSAGARKDLRARNLERDSEENSSMDNSTQGFNGKCYHCRRVGHRRADCSLLF